MMQEPLRHCLVSSTATDAPTNHYFLFRNTKWIGAHNNDQTPLRKMENLTLEDAPPQGASGGAQMPLLGAGIPPPQSQQLPPQMFTTAAQLLDMTDSKVSLVSASQVLLEGAVSLLSAFLSQSYAVKESHASDNIGSLCKKSVLIFSSPEKLMVALRDGRKLIGVLRSWDQFGDYLPFLSPHSTLLTISPSKPRPPINRRAYLCSPAIRLLLKQAFVSHAARSLRGCPSRNFSCSGRERVVAWRDRFRQG
jgi:hypothetical protein